MSGWIWSAFTNLHFSAIMKGPPQNPTCIPPGKDQWLATPWPLTFRQPLGVANAIDPFTTVYMVSVVHSSYKFHKKQVSNETERFGTYPASALALQYIWFWDPPEYKSFRDLTSSKRQILEQLSSEKEWTLSYIPVYWLDDVDPHKWLFVFPK